uniref:Nucleotide exchange factor Fes1 family protein n=1 Tax=Trepomonas sp. PC1 TaxID=1076344 RepID=A0A146K2D2_9EUKA|eukprot:JAP91052.1 Nucleotide exchange factor Fes1 family protein [Trepomonas sp. PC1]
MIYEWSMRNQNPSYNENIQVDLEKIEWLRKAWDEMVVDGATLMKNCLKLINDPQTPLDDKYQILEQLADLLENIDNALVMKQLQGWKILLEQFQITKWPIILHCVYIGMHNAPQVQQDVIEIWLDTIAEQVKQMDEDNQKQILAILGTLYQNKNIVQKVDQEMKVNFIQVYKDKGFESERYNHLIQLFESVNEEEEWYNQLIRKLIK